MRRQPKTTTNQKGRSTRISQTGVELKKKETKNKQLQTDNNKSWRLITAKISTFWSSVLRPVLSARHQVKLRFFDIEQWSLIFVELVTDYAKSKTLDSQSLKRVKQTTALSLKNTRLLDKQLQELFSFQVYFLTSKVLVLAFLTVHRKWCFFHSI